MLPTARPLLVLPIGHCVIVEKGHKSEACLREISVGISSGEMPDDETSRAKLNEITELCKSFAVCYICQQ